MSHMQGWWGRFPPEAQNAGLPSIFEHGNMGERLLYGLQRLSLFVTRLTYMLLYESPGGLLKDGVAEVPIFHLATLNHNGIRFGMLKEK